MEGVSRNASSSLVLEGGWGNLDEIPPACSAVDFGRVISSPAGIEKKNKLNLSTLIWEKHLNIKIASCWYQKVGLGARE